MWKITIGVVVGVLAAGPALAQQGTAQIAGKVSDEQGAVLPGVAIVVTNEETGAFREVTSSAEGTYLASQLVPGRYRIVAQLTGFRRMERSGLILPVGTTLTINLALAVGGVEETITVTGQSPLVDTTSARVGGNISTAELSELPAMNRNYFNSVALLPGVQFTPSTQMGNDTIIAAGQTSQNNNVSVDGGYNADDALGTSAGAQTRVPIEAIQEFQVLTGMYDAEYGRAGGAILNAVSKAGTNQFRGVVFTSLASNAMTSTDFLVREGGLAKPSVTKRDWGGVIGGPIVRNKAHFFFSLERQVDNPNRTRVYDTRPEFNFSVVEERSNWNTMIRFDHQINATHTWSVRWLRETAPQFPTGIGAKHTRETFQDETDIDQNAIGTLTSVFGNARVNTLRVARTWEHWWHGNECWRAQGAETARPPQDNQQSRCLPQLDFLQVLTQASTEAQGPWDSNYQIEDHFSWFVPGKAGDHELKFGGRYNYTELQRVSQINQNGTFTFNHNGPFDRANPRTYPERLEIRLGEFYEFINNHSYELYAQDKWKIGASTTLNLGVRYDLEVIPLNETDNPLFPSGDKHYPVDRNNVAPRLGITHALDDQGKSVIRAGYGMFYNRTLLGAVDDTIEFAKYTSSSEANFPNDAADPGPSRGQFPSHPLLANGPVLNRVLLDQMFPPGTLIKSAGVVIFDSPNRKQPYAHQATIGYGRELTPSLAVQADYMFVRNRDMFLARNLNPSERANTSRTGAITRRDAFGILGETYNQQVWVMENAGSNDYDALNLSLEKRYADFWSGRISYSLSKSRGNAENQSDKNTYQFLDDLNLDELWGPSQVDRRHVLTINGRTELPKTHGVTLSSTLRYMSAAPFTIFNSNVDVNRNGELNDPLPAGTYSGTAVRAMQNVESKGGRNGARGPDYFQIDVRAGWRARMPNSHALEVFLDILNITNRTNWDNPSGDQRNASTFLQLRQLRGGSGFPRQAAVGMRYVF
jgi:hypothetical protein